MRTAVLVSGQFRSGAHCYPSIKKHVLDRIGEHDVFMHLAMDEDSEKAHVYDYRKLEVVHQPDLDEKNYIHRSGRQVFGIQQCLRMWWSMREAYRLMESSGVKYDWVIRLRPDTEFLTSLEPLSELDPEGIYLPTFANWWGYNDRFAVMGQRWAPVYHSMFDNLDRYIEQGGIFHPETYLKCTLDQFGPVGRTNVLFDTVRVDGRRVMPAYHASTGDILTT